MVSISALAYTSFPCKVKNTYIYPSDRGKQKENVRRWSGSPPKNTTVVRRYTWCRLNKIWDFSCVYKRQQSQSVACFWLVENSDGKFELNQLFPFCSLQAHSPVKPERGRKENKMRFSVNNIYKFTNDTMPSVRIKTCKLIFWSHD